MGEANNSSVCLIYLKTFKMPNDKGNPSWQWKIQIFIEAQKIKNGNLFCNPKPVK